MSDNTSGEETDHYRKQEGERDNGRNRSIHTNSDVEHHKKTVKTSITMTKHSTKSDSEIEQNLYTGLTKRKTIRERNALHSINIRGKRELYYKFTNNINKTKPSKATTSTTNNQINNNRETPTMNTPNKPQPPENTIVDTNTQNQVTNKENTTITDNITPIATHKRKYYRSTKTHPTTNPHQ